MDYEKIVWKEGQSVFIDKDFLVDCYINKLMTLEEISSELDGKVSYECVRTNLKRYNICRTEEQKRLARMKHQERIKESNLIKYGVENVSQLQSVKDKKEATFIDRYGVTTYLNTEQVSMIKSAPKSEEWKQKRRKYKTEEQRREARRGAQKERQKRASEERAANRMLKYGSLRHDAPGYLEKERETCMEKYGVPYPCMRAECRVATKNDSAPNRKFAKVLSDYAVEFEREVTLGRYSYDFKVGNTLIEINPTITHNIDWHPFGDHRGIDFNYHKDKSEVAFSNGYGCIHVWDWDDFCIVASLLIDRKKLYARKCSIRYLTQEECREFLLKYHTQSYTHGQPIRIGLLLDDEIISVMTFGKARYRSDCDYELLRFCTKSGISVVGGASKLFSFFLQEFNPKSVVSYCDLSKFSGDIYNSLGFTLLKVNSPSIHWSNPNSGCHITDNLLRKNGYDRLFGTDFGKGTSNAELMLASGFFRVADCGQATYIFRQQL